MREGAGRKAFWRPELGSVTVSILTALYLLALTNFSFWSKGWTYLEGRPTTFASIAIGIACLYIALCVAVSVKYVMKPFFILLILSAAAGAWFMDQYGVVIDTEMFRNVAETNSAEAGHLFTAGFVLHMLAYGVLPSLLLVWDQLSLFDLTPTRGRDDGSGVQETEWPADVRQLGDRLPASVRFGTSSWSFPGWAGLVYRRPRTQTELARDGLREYARYPLFGTVGIDRSYYAPLTGEDLKRYAAQLPTGFPCETLAVCGDIRDEALWESLDLTGLDHAVVNAGVAGAGVIADLALDEWRRILSVNLDGAFLTLRAAMRAMRARGGSIVLTASAAGVKAEPGVAAYGASKAALIHLAKVAAKEGAPQSRYVEIFS